ncbi:MAG TPA: hypothetical protein DCE44_06330 [Verrucomicrobiales bacterium]|nr:hypothetical protein [Verrucomicrobiales bacterium]
MFVVHRYRAGLLVGLMWIGLTRVVAADRLLADFEGSDFAGWVATGTAFGTGPALGTLMDQAPVNGFRGQGLANSFHGGDKAVGTLKSPDFDVDQRFLNFLIGGGEVVGKTCVNLVVDGQVVRSATGRDEESLTTITFDLDEFVGKRARLEIVDNEPGGWGHITADHFVLSDRAAVPPYVQNLKTPEEYLETLRPQFHFTARSNWLNDPNGLVFHAGEYHLFYQHNPFGREWGNMTWAHSVSSNLVNWTPLALALKPDRLGTMFSGSAVVDRENTGGFQVGSEPALVAIYTAAGGSSDESKGHPFTQCLAYSNDRGRTWTKFSGNPVLTNLGVGDRDPKVFWHVPTRHWVMPLYVGVKDPHRPDRSLGERHVKPELRLFTSPDLKSWTQTSVFPEELYECPGLVELPVDGDPKNTRWVVWGADGRYWICRFDGRTLTPESGPHMADFGANYYAAQTWDDLPQSRVVQIGWMRGGKYPDMPFNGQMGFPVELTLQTSADGLRLVKWPVREIRDLFTSVLREDLPRPLRPGSYALPGAARELMDLEFEFRPGLATSVTLEVRGQAIVWSANPGSLAMHGQTIPLRPASETTGRRSEFSAPWGPDFVPWTDSIRIRVLLDRTSVELFANGGIAVASFCFVPEKAPETSITVAGGDVARARVTTRQLKSAWRP